MWTFDVADSVAAAVSSSVVVVVSPFSLLVFIFTLDPSPPLPPPLLPPPSSAAVALFNSLSRSSPVDVTSDAVSIAVFSPATVAVARFTSFELSVVVCSLEEEAGAEEEDEVTSFLLFSPTSSSCHLSLLTCCWLLQLLETDLRSESATTTYLLFSLTSAGERVPS